MSLNYVDKVRFEKVKTCDKCGAQVAWYQTKAGKWALMDVEYGQNIVRPHIMNCERLQQKAWVTLDKLEARICLGEPNPENALETGWILCPNVLRGTLINHLGGREYRDDLNSGDYPYQAYKHLYAQPQGVWLLLPTGFGAYWSMAVGDRIEKRLASAIRA